MVLSLGNIPMPRLAKPMATNGMEMKVASVSLPERIL